MPRLKILITTALWVTMSFFAIGCDGDSNGQSPEAIVSSESKNRHVPLQKQSNFRDIGGYTTADGRNVKWELVYRSGRLSSLTEDDVAKLDELRIKTVINFLTTAEIETDGPDRLPAGVAEKRLSMEAGNMAELTAIVDQARRTGDFSAVSPAINPDIHRRLIVEGREYYAELMRSLADSSNLPLAFHCSHGVHRTGTATAIILSALGVPWETIREDYLLSNKYRQKEIGPRLKQLRQKYATSKGIDPADIDTTNMEAFYILQGDYIDASLEQAIADFGSMDAYIREGLGLSEEEIGALRANLLTD